MAVSGDWQAAYGGLDFGDGTDYGIAPPIEGLQDMPDLVSSDRPRLRRHGLVAGTDFLAGRSTVWRLEISATDNADLDAKVTALKAAVKPGQTECALTFQIPGVAGGGVRRILARPRRYAMPIDLAHYFGLPLATIQWDATDPRIYDDTESSVSTGITASVAGLTWPLTWDMNWGGTSTSDTVIATNAGTFDSPWKATISGPVSAIKVENTDTGQTLDLTADSGLSLADGDTLVIDSDSKTVLLNGTASRYNKLTGDSEWWDLPPGDTSIRFHGTTSGSPTMTVTWRSAWI